MKHKRINYWYVIIENNFHDWPSWEILIGGQCNFIRVREKKRAEMARTRVGMMGNWLGGGQAKQGSVGLSLLFFRSQQQQITLKLFTCWVILHTFLSYMDFFLNLLFQKTLIGIPSEYQTVWLQIRPYILSGLIWIQTTCKGYQQMTKIATSWERAYIFIIFPGK